MLDVNCDFGGIGSEDFFSAELKKGRQAHVHTE